VAPSAESTAKIEAAEASGIRFIQLQFTDIIGHVKAVTIPIHQLEGSVEHGTWFDGSSIEGFTRIAESDQYLMPDMDTFSEIPWQPGSGPRHLRRLHAAWRAVRRRSALRPASPGRACPGDGLRRQHRPGARVLPVQAW
jgi:glutamine synthetase